MQVPGIDDSVDRGAFPSLGVPAEAADEYRPRIGAYANRTRVAWQIGDRRSIRKLDVGCREVNKQLGAERLAQLDGPMEQAIRRRVRRESGVRRVARTDTISTGSSSEWPKRLP